MATQHVNAEMCIQMFK